MNNILPKLLFTLALCLTALLVPVTHAYAAPSILFDKTDVTVAQNATFNVTVKINVDAYAAQSAAVTIVYAPADLEVVQVANANFFPSFLQANDGTNGVMEITGYTQSSGGSTANGNLATITFKAKKGSGNSAITFRCDGGGHDTTILTTAGQNIFSSCSPINTLGVSYTGANVPTNTPTPTLAAGVTPTPTPTPTPVSGNTYPVCANLGASVTSAVGTPLAVTFTCSGVDTDGYINGAYFDFGDGTNYTITQNVGSPGAISTTHTYTTIGSLGASCKVQDNNKVWSTVPDVCKKIIYIKPKVVTSNRVTTPQTGTPTPTPTPASLTLVYVTPTATPSPQLTPTPTTKPQQAASPSGLLLGSIAVIVVGGIIYFLGNRKRKTPPIPPAVPGAPPIIP